MCSKIGGTSKDMACCLVVYLLAMSLNMKNTFTSTFINTKNEMKEQKVDST